MKCCEVCKTSNVPIASGSFSSSLSKSSPFVSLNVGLDQSGGTLASNASESKDYHTEASLSTAVAQLQDAFEYIRLKKSEYDHLRSQDVEYCEAIKDSLALQNQSHASIAFLLAEVPEVVEDSTDNVYGVMTNESMDMILRKKRRELAKLQEQRNQLLVQNQFNNAKLVALAERREYLATHADFLSKRAATIHLKQAVFNGIEKAISCKAQTINYMRLQMIIKLFKSMPIVVNYSMCKRSTSSRRPVHLQGCSSIMSLPIPNSGHFETFPIDIVSPALGYIAQLIDGIAAILNISLPHPVRPFALNGLSAISPQFAEDSKVYCLSPLTMHNNRDTLREFNWMSMKSFVEEKKKRTALQVDGENASDDYDLDEMGAINPDFPKALMLLKANVVSLCGKFGLHPSKLWPSDAMLLNLKLLEEHTHSLLGTHTETDYPLLSLSSENWEDEATNILKEKLCNRFVPLHMATTHDPNDIIDWNLLAEDREVDRSDGEYYPDIEEDEWDMVERGSI